MGYLTSSLLSPEYTQPFGYVIVRRAMRESACGGGTPESSSDPYIGRYNVKFA